MSGFKRYFVKRIAYIAATLLGISFVVFSITQLLPGNAATMILGKYATEASVRAVEQRLGLNHPWYIQYFDWLSGFVAGDWGHSFDNNQAVMEVIAPRFVRSLTLAIITLGLVTVVGISLGVLAAVKRDSASDVLVSGFSYLGISFPEFVTGILLLTLFAGPVFQVFPFGGYESLSEGFVPWFKHLILPAVTLTFVLIAHVVRLTRSEMVEVLQSEYIRTARLKGAKEHAVLLKHGLRNGLLPTITLLALDLGYLMGSIVIVEEVFSYPGLGRLIVSSIHARDLPVIQASVMLIAIIYTFANFGADIIYTYLDPRINYGDT
ncbi:peptide/nickel transport system permease protein [Halogeometricum rufum]|uniref:Peptide/nickel transport system permease protein n=1 Tax=Halogeometricum rufum TaxID=553469 RepID=A0A1I6IR53_9EURY|nr:MULTISPECIES: ABC transporter permease [Halogeometricum]MUV56396.1 ABC transporter permease subunit [Halogeometricum sp. CBA1124]SFR69101.1 peptide/nickel transport system permease protein [Halogeometricum rufum]